MRDSAKQLHQTDAGVLRANAEALAQPNKNGAAKLETVLINSFAHLDMTLCHCRQEELKQWKSSRKGTPQLYWPSVPH